MRAFAGGLAVALAVGAVTVAHATPAPQPVAAMIAAAAKSGDTTALSTVVRIAKDTNPDSIAEIEALVAMLAAADLPAGAAAASVPPATQLASASAPAQTPAAPAAPQPPPLWKGSVELGGSVAQGASDVAGAYGVLDLTRTGPMWSQRTTFRGDYQKTDGRTTTERLSLAYEPRARLSADRYAFGLAQIEHDGMLGYDLRYTIGAGLGLQVSDRPGLKIAVDFGPALRLTDRRDASEERSVAGRGSLNIRWLPTDRVTIAQEGAVYTEQAQATAKSITSVETVLFGPLKARLSYNLQYERNPASANGAALDTTTRAALLYQF